MFFFMVETVFYFLVSMLAPLDGVDKTQLLWYAALLHQLVMLTIAKEKAYLSLT